MSVPIIIAPAAEADLLEAIGWYESNHSDLSFDFRLSLDAALDHIVRYPEACALWPLPCAVPCCAVFRMPSITANKKTVSRFLPFSTRIEILVSGKSVSNSATSQTRRFQPMPARTAAFPSFFVNPVLMAPRHPCRPRDSGLRFASASVPAAIAPSNPLSQITGQSPAPLWIPHRDSSRLSPAL